LHHQSHARGRFWKRTTTLLTTVAAAAALMLAGCTAAPPADSESTGGSLRIATPDGVPAAFNLGSAYPLSTLTFYEVAWPLFLPSQSDFDIENGLADSYERSDDGLVHTIGIREGMTFHDGSAIDAASVVEVLESYFFADSPLRDEGAYSIVSGAFGSPPTIASVEAVDDLTVAITLTEPRADIRDPLFQMPIMNPRVMAEEGWETDVELLGQAGSGPFRITNFSPGAFIEFERYEDFIEPVSLDRLRIEQIVDPAARALAVQSGNVDVALELTPEDHVRLAGTEGFQEHASQAGNNVFMRLLPPHLPELDDPRVREAISLAMNVEAYREAFLNPATAQASTQPVVVAGVAGHNPSIPAHEYDPEKARELLEEAGVTDLTLRTLTMETSGPLLELRAMHEAVAADLEAVGITVELDVVDEPTYFAERYNYDYEILWYGNGYNPDFIFRLFYLGYPNPWSEPYPLADPRVAQLVREATTSIDRDQQIANWQELQRLNHDELFVGVPIADVGSSAISTAQVHGFELGWSDRGKLAWLFQDTTVG